MSGNRSNGGLKVAVLGAAGTIAPAIVRDLAESDEVERMLLLDLDGRRAAAVAAEHGGGRAVSATADARRGLAAAIEGCEVVINSASYRINLDAMAACLDAGAHYLDLGGLYWMTDRQLELHDRFESAGLLGLLGIGSSPGKTNLMAARAVRELNAGSAGLAADGVAAVDSIHVSAAGRDLDPPPGFSVPYALRTLLDELTMRPIEIRNGKPAEIEPLAPGGVVDFGEPIGAAETIHTLHSEMLTFPSSFGCGQSSFRLSLAPALLERLRELAAAASGELEATVAGRPSAQTVSVHQIEAAGPRGSVRVRALTTPREEWGMGGGVVSTAAPAAAAVRLLARGRIDARGVLPPERCIDADEMFAELERRGTEFTVETMEEAAA